MIRQLLFLLGVGVMLVPLTGRAADDESGWSDCNGTILSTQPTSIKVRPGGAFCYEWENQGVTNDSSIFRVMEDSLGSICFDPDKAQAGATGGGEVIPRKCLGVTPASGNANACVGALPNTCTSLTGAEGAENSQCACVIVGPGNYYLDLTAIVADGEDAIVEIRGEKP